MRIYLLSFIMGSSFLLMACNNQDDQKDNSPKPSPTPNCKIHCAP